MPMGYYLTVFHSIRHSTYKLATIAGIFNGDHGLTLFVPPNTTCGLVGHVSVLLTFGVLYPPLAVVITLYFYTTTYTWHSLFDKFFRYSNSDTSGTSTSGVGPDERTLSVDSSNSEFSKTNHEQIKKDLELQCTHLWKVLYDSRYVLLFITSMFYAMFLLDMAGDKSNNVFHILWLPLCMVFVGLLIGKNKVKLYNDTRVVIVQSAIELVQIINRVGPRARSTSTTSNNL